jgi:amino acid adenylation domain-containing protein
MAAPMKDPTILSDHSPEVDRQPGPVARRISGSVNQPVRRCMLVGEGNMLIASGLLLREAGLRISGVVSDDAAAVQWANSLEIPMIGYGDELVASLERSPVDYLFSVINLRILPAEALKLPRIAAINFHDGPLPRYAGLHATSWALFNREKTHGITWHLMESTIDTGPIVRQRWFEVAEDDTALSLNLKCFNTGLASLADMVSDLVQGTITATPQDAARRTYCAGSRRPAAGGILEWDRRGEESEAMARGTDFGPYRNPLVLPKIWTGAECIVAREVRFGEVAASGPPGAVLAIDETSLTIATGSRPVTMGGLATIDGESLSVAETVRRYQLHVGCVLPLLPPECVERLTSSSETLTRHERYWAGRLQSLCPVSPLRVRRTDRDGKTRAMVSQVWHVPEEVVGCLARLGHRFQMEEFLLAAFGSFLARLGVLDGFDVECRDAGTQPPDPLGMFAEHVPFRFDIDDDFDVVLHRVREERARLARHQTYPRDLIPRSPALHCQAALLRRGKLPVAVELGAVGDAVDSGHDLVMRFPREGCEGLAVFEAACQSEMALILDRFSTFLRNLAAGETVSLRGIPLVGDRERETVLEEWSSTGPADQSMDCLHHLVESQAARTPNAVAVQCGSVELTYRELNARAERLAGRLTRLGVGAESLVGVCMERSPEAIVGILGILKAGGVYVPLDPAYPRHRLAFMVEDSEMRAVVSVRNLAERLPAGPMPRIYLDVDELGKAADTPVGPPVVTHRNLAYIIYTSGSTGEPKGVMVEHCAVVNFIRAAQTRYGLRPGDRVLQFASMNFDASVEEIFSCLSSGGTLVLRNDEMLASARGFMEQCAAWRINVLDLPTAFWQKLVMQMRESGLPPCPDLRVAIIGGEAASPAQVAAWREMAGPHIALFNTYGPTEATVVSTWVELGDREVSDEVPIGVPIAGATAYVLDRWGQPLPHGVMGQLHIGGAGLARGYLNRPQLTAERFVPDTFGSVPGGRLYRTGDLCSWRADGMLAFHGRIDDQVKIRGHRIELGEIEAVLLSVPGIRQAAVVARDLKPGDTRLVAYLAEDSGGVTDDVIRNAVACVLPEFMMPAAFVRLEWLPLTPNGKIDRTSLPMSDLQRPSDNPRAEPRTMLEKRLADVWRGVLGVDSVGVHDDFFHSGGNSLVAMELLARVRETWEVELPLRLLFERRTIAEQAEFIVARIDDAPTPRPADDPSISAWSSLVPLKPNGSRPPLFLVHGMGGDVFYYVGLAGLMSSDQPVYGVRAIELDGRSRRHETVEEMARHYAQEIRRFQPVGPYWVSGYSAGGWIAYAVATELRRQGQQVTVLILDTFPWCRLPWPAGGMKLLFNALTLISGLKNHVRKMAVMPVREWPRYVASRLDARGVPGFAARHQSRPAGDAGVHVDPSDSPFSDRFALAIARYTARSMDGRVELFLGRAPLVPAALARCQIALWKMLVQGPVRVHRLPCEHLEMLSPEHLPVLAAILDMVLADEPRLKAPVGGGS